MSEITYTRDTVTIQTDKGLLYALPPVHRRDTTEFWPAVAAGHGLSKDQAELLARTVAPHLFPEEGTEPWRKPVREIYEELLRTERSYRRDRNAAAAGYWTATQVRDSLTDLLDAVRGTLRQLEELL